MKNLFNRLPKIPAWLRLKRLIQAACVAVVACWLVQIFVWPIDLFWGWVMIGLICVAAIAWLLDDEEVEWWQGRLDIRDTHAHTLITVWHMKMHKMSLFPKQMICASLKIAVLIFMTQVQKLSDRQTGIRFVMSTKDDGGLSDGYWEINS